MEQDRTPPLLPHQSQLAAPPPGNLPNHRQPHRQHHNHHRTHRPLRTRHQPLPHQNQTHQTTERINPSDQARISRRVELHNQTQSMKILYNSDSLLQKTKDASRFTSIGWVNSARYWTSRTLGSSMGSSESCGSTSAVSRLG